MPTLNITLNVPTADPLDIEDLKQRVTSYANSLVAQYFASPTNKEHSADVYISGRIKAMETGFEYNGYLSDDYKNEIKQRRSEHYI